MEEMEWKSQTATCIEELQGSCHHSHSCFNPEMIKSLDHLATVHSP